MIASNASERRPKRSTASIAAKSSAATASYAGSCVITRSAGSGCAMGLGPAVWSSTLTQRAPPVFLARLSYDFAVAAAPCVLRDALLRSTPQDEDMLYVLQ